MAMTVSDERVQRKVWSIQSWGRGEMAKLCWVKMISPSAVLATVRI
jgi:hypothetical protein